MQHDKKASSLRLRWPAGHRSHRPTLNTKPVDHYEFDEIRICNKAFAVGKRFPLSTLISQIT